VKHQEEAAKIVIANDTTGAQTLKHQIVMMKEIAKLITDSKEPLGYLNPRDYERTVAELKEQGIIKGTPEGAWTHTIWEASKKWFDPEKAM
jgi:NitT/TauT family transport system substrate-binding protein